MNIIGPDSLVFGVDDVDACSRYFTDYGLTPAGDGRFEALDGTSVVIKPKDDASLPAALETGSKLRKIATSKPWATARTKPSTTWALHWAFRSQCARPWISRVKSSTHRVWTPTDRSM